MQDIVIYAAANETLGIVRDYANARNQAAPVLVLGVSVCLRIRLFTACEVATPYPISAFNGIADWLWNMDSDFDRSTTCKLAADADAISVHTVTDTINGETLDFTEFVIPISNMNTQELATWLGNEKKRSGLNGELVGYDSAGNAAFVLQIENFTVRNRVAGLGDPTALDQGIVTRSIAEHMIQSAVSSSASTKQDKLTAGYRMAIVSGSTVDQSRWFPIESPTGSTVTLMAGHAYRLNTTASSKTLNTETAPENSFGLEGHLEIFVAGTGFVKTGANVVLSQPLAPDSVNNCTVRFHDGLAIISVEDHVAGYIVVSASGSTAGTLPFALSSASQEYVAFDASLNGSTLDLGGAVTNGEKHVVGNGYTDTILTGGMSCTSKTTFANLSMDGASVTGGTMILGDVYIPSGATVSVSGGGLAVEKVTGDGGTLDLGETNLNLSKSYIAGIEFTGYTSVRQYGGYAQAFNANATFVNCKFTGGVASGGGAIWMAGGTYSMTGCEITGNTSTVGNFRGGGGLTLNGGDLTISNSIVSGNVQSNGKDIYVGGSGTKLILAGGNTIGNTNFRPSAGPAGITFMGSNHIDSVGGLAAGTSAGALTVTISEGATIDLTSGMAPGGGVTFAPGGAIIYPGGVTANAYALGGVTVPQLGNTNVVNLNGSNVLVSNGRTVYASRCTFTGGTASGDAAGAFLIRGSSLFSSCTISGNTATYGGGAYVDLGGSATFKDSIISGNVQTYGEITINSAGSVDVNGGTIGKIGFLKNGGNLSLEGQVKLERVAAYANASGFVTISSGASINLTSSIVPGGGIDMPARPESASVKIFYTDPDAPTPGYSSRTFEELEIHGTTITNLGIIYGATVTIPADTQDTWIVSTTEGTVELTSASAGDYVVNGGLKNIEKS